MTALTQDISIMKEREKVDVASQLIQAARESGCSPFSMAIDFLKLRRQRGKLNFYEYILYGLYDKSHWSEEERDEFVSAHIHWPLVNVCNDRKWWALSEDKWLSACFLQQNSIPVPETLAVFDMGMRHFGDTKCMKTADEIKSFFKSCDAYPIFAKPIGGIWSAGAMRISGHTETHVLLDGKEALTFEELADDVISDQPYIFQKCLKPHGFFDGLTDAVATIRCLNLIKKDGLHVPHTLLKLPQQGNIADNLWRPGNLLCEIDPETGTIVALVTVKDGRRSTLDALPDADRALVGETLPFWNELKDLNTRVALLHAANRYGSTDIALTPDGPVVVEVNNSCAFELIQIATGKGFMNDEMTSFFRGCGATI